MSSYKIEVCLMPDYVDNSAKPYHWILFSYAGGDWRNECAGWADSITAAWTEAYAFFQNHIQH